MTSDYPNIFFFYFNTFDLSVFQCKSVFSHLVFIVSLLLNADKQFVQLYYEIKKHKIIDVMAKTCSDVGQTDFNEPFGLKKVKIFFPAPS